MADRELTEGSIRHRYRDLEPESTDNDNKAFARYVSMAPVTPLGHTRQTITNTPAPVDDVPAGTKRVHIYNLSTDTDVYFTDFAGQEPDATLGFPIKADSWMNYDVEISDDFLLATLSGTASLAFAFYG